MKKFSVRSMAEIAIFAALGFALDIFQSGLWRGVFINGGSIGLAMLPVLIISYRRGFKEGLLTGFIISFLQMLGGVYAIADTWFKVMLQIMLDYILAYPLVAFAGLFFKKFKESSDNKAKNTYLVVGCVVGGTLKFLSHFLAGVIFWSSSCPDGFLGGPVVYSLVYNGGYCLPNIIICALILVLIQMKQPKILVVNERKEVVQNEETI